MGAEHQVLAGNQPGSSRAMMSHARSSWFLPREHGAWGIVLIPFITSLAITGELGLQVWVALLAVMLVFIARYPLELLLIPVARKRAGSPSRQALWKAFVWYGAAALMVGLTLVQVWRLYVLLLLALIGGYAFVLRVWFGIRGEERTLVAEGIGSAGLTLSSLVAWVAATGSADATGILIWFLNCIFFCSGILYVKARIRAKVLGQETAGYNEVTVSLILQIVLFGLVAVMELAGWLSALVVVPFALAALRAAWGLYAREGPFALRRLGWSEVALSVLFAVFLTAGFHL